MDVTVFMGLGVAGLVALRVQHNRRARRAKNLPERLWFTLVSEFRGEKRTRIRS